MATSATSNNIAYTYTTTTPGEYQLTFYDGSGTPLSSVVYRVHPLQTQWLSTATNTSLGRFVIKNRSVADADVSDPFCGVSIMQQGSSVVVQSAVDNLRSMEIRSIGGQLTGRVKGSHAHRLQTAIVPGIHIVSIELEDGKSKSYKLLFNDK